MDEGKLIKHWPERVDEHTIVDVPDHIARAAEEAHLNLAHGCYRSAVMLARAVVEATAKEKGFTSGNLAKKIDDLHSHGHIRELVKHAAHEVRFLGNDMAHGDFVDGIAEAEAEEVVQLMDEVLDEVFQAPTRLERRKKARLAKES